MIKVTENQFNWFVKKHKLKQHMLPFGFGWSYEDRTGVQMAIEDENGFEVCEYTEDEINNSGVK